MNGVITLRSWPSISTALEVAFLARLLPASVALAPVHHVFVMTSRESGPNRREFGPNFPQLHTVTETQRASGASLTVSPFTLDPL